MLKGRKMSQNSRVRKRIRGLRMKGVRSVLEEGLGGVGGCEGMKKEGMLATVDCGEWLAGEFIMRGRAVRDIRLWRRRGPYLGLRLSSSPSWGLSVGPTHRLMGSQGLRRLLHWFVLGLRTRRRYSALGLPGRMAAQTR